MASRSGFEAVKFTFLMEAEYRDSISNNEATQIDRSEEHRATARAPRVESLAPNTNVSNLRPTIETFAQNAKHDLEIH
jgi:hypothetical protein